jgi:anthranilate phosphoribosyltransferase
VSPETPDRCNDLPLTALLAGQLDEPTALATLQRLAVPHLNTTVLAQVWHTLMAMAPTLPPLPHPVMDCCGTGGSGLPHFNTSTCVAFVLAAAGVPVVKFGNRAATSASGSFDFLEALGLPATTWPVDQLADRLAAGGGLVFLSAAQVFPGLVGLGPLRKQLGQPTAFNVLGPLLNPVRPAYRLMGLSKGELLPWLAPLAAGYPGHRQTLMVTGHNGLDEVTLDGPTVGRLITTPSQGGTKEMPWTYSPATAKGLTVPVANGDGSAQANVARFTAMMTGTDTSSAEYHLVCLNAGVGLWIRGLSASVADGVTVAQAQFASGAVAAQLDQVRRVAQH